MPSPLVHSTPTKPAHPGGGVSLLPAKFGPTSPSKSCYSPQSPIRSSPNDDVRELAERRRARQSMTPTKPVARFDSICQESKKILNDMAGMFSPKKGEARTPEVPSFKIEKEVPPAAFPVKEEQSEKGCGDNQRKHGQAQKKRVVNRGRIKRPARPLADPVPEEGSSKRRP